MCLDKYDWLRNWLGGLVLAHWDTILDKTTWESFPHHVHFPTQQNYFQNDAFAERNPFPQFNVASHKRPGIRLSFEYPTTLLSGEGGEERTGTATMFRKMLSQYTIFSTVLSKIVASQTFFGVHHAFLTRLSLLIWAEKNVGQSQQTSRSGKCTLDLAKCRTWHISSRKDQKGLMKKGEDLTVEQTTQLTHKRLY